MGQYNLHKHKKTSKQSPWFLLKIPISEYLFMHVHCTQSTLSSFHYLLCTISQQNAHNHRRKGQKSQDAIILFPGLAKT